MGAVANSRKNVAAISLKKVGYFRGGGELKVNFF